MLNSWNGVGLKPAQQSEGFFISFVLHGERREHWQGRQEVQCLWQKWVEIKPFYPRWITLIFPVHRQDILLQHLEGFGVLCSDEQEIIFWLRWLPLQKYHLIVGRGELVQLTSAINNLFFSANDGAMGKIPTPNVKCVGNWAAALFLFSPSFDLADFHYRKWGACWNHGFRWS